MYQSAGDAVQLAAGVAVAVGEGRIGVAEHLAEAVVGDSRLHRAGAVREVANAPLAIRVVPGDRARHAFPRHEFIYRIAKEPPRGEGIAAVQVRPDVEVL